ncbi:alpha/beta hydrolase [Halobacterium salinarum]|uniref:alpha/beta fold hydrolase n=1 Tax=Halobacterium salinarum TaxID=2242 RepID=UPI001F3D003A|nr:alpha/beta hydrolase [Halobacterium salinarum]MCF2164955.1 alpha/beta hydrolase [Halobacterium salinarum]MCF2168951.1 alpha/beta hydrolase [Halobacterium salinarum]MCF2237675.1 alpha/beta hydrolase [Halobacterium salinarum]
MKLRQIAGSLAAATGVVAATNAALAWRADELASPLDGTNNTYQWRGFDIAYTEAGDPDDQDVVLLHGLNAAGSSFEFRNVFDALAADHHVIAPDLPGFGRSDRPPIEYAASHYTTFVADFLADAAEDPMVVASSHSGAYATAAAADTDSVSELVLVCPTTAGFSGTRPLVGALVRAPVVGTALFNVATSKRAIRYFNADHGYHDESVVTEDVVEYHWRTAHQPGARFAAASFFAGALDVDMDLGAELAALDLPVTVVWGQEATISPVADGRDIADAAGARLVVLEESDVQPHVERPEAFLRDAVEPSAVVEGSKQSSGGEDVKHATDGA